MEGNNIIYHNSNDILAHEKFHNKWDVYAAMGLFVNPRPMWSVYQKGGCKRSFDKYSDVNGNENVRLDCGLMDYAIMEYKKVLLKMAKGHYIKFKEMQDLYKHILIVETTARVKGFKTNNCNTYGK